MIRHLLTRAAAAIALATLAACTAMEKAPPPVAAPSLTPAPAPAQLITPSFENWMDAPQTPGDWVYAGTGAGRSYAAFGAPQSEPRFTIRCDRARQSVSLVRTGEAEGPVQMRILTETGDRLLRALPSGSERPSVAAAVTADDPLLDMMAISKGRFAVETAGLPTLYLPSWPEVTRVVEDCR